MLHSKNYLSGCYSHIGGGKFLLGHGLAHDTIWPTNTFAQSKKKKDLPHWVAWSTRLQPN